MLSPTDLLHIPCTPDLTEGGIAVACRGLVKASNRMDGSPFERLRRCVGAAVVELAFRRHLGGEGVDFTLLKALPFTDPDRYEVALGGHRCDLVSSLVSRRRQISLVRRDPGLLLDTPALIPVEQATAEGHSSQDILLFAFLLALTTPSLADLRRAIAAGQPVHLIQPLPEAWVRPPRWQPLEGLALKSECEQPIPVEIGGLDREHSPVSLSLDLPPRQRVPVPGELYSAAYLHAGRLPERRLGLHSPVCGAAHLLQPHEWGNIWIYGMDIWLAGWLTRAEYRRRSAPLPAGSRTFQFDRTREKNPAVPVRDLRPVGELFERVKGWQAERRLSR